MQSTIESLSRRTRRYWLIDGLAEITLDGLLLGVILLAIGQGLKRFYLLSAASVSIRLLLSLNHIGGSQGHAAFYSLIGLALLASGCLTLVFYLREHQEIGEEIQ